MSQMYVSQKRACLMNGRDDITDALIWLSNNGRDT